MIRRSLSHDVASRPLQKVNAIIGTKFNQDCGHLSLSARQIASSIPNSDLLAISTWHVFDRELAGNL